MGLFDPLKRRIARGQDVMKDRARELVLTATFARDPDVDLIVKTAILESIVALPARFGPGHLAATILRHPTLRDALDATSRSRLRDELLATKRPRRTKIALRTLRMRLKDVGQFRNLGPRELDEAATPLAYGAISGVHWGATTSFIELLRMLEDDHPELRTALASASPLDLSMQYRVVIDEARVVPLRSAPASASASVVELYVLTGDVGSSKPSKPPTRAVIEALVDAFEISEIDAFFACAAARAHGAALVATLPQPEAEERIFAATRQLRLVGSDSVFRMLRAATAS